MTDPRDLPAPPVPPDVDLRGLEWMPLFGAKLFDSDFNLNASDTEFRVGLKLWWKAWNQVPASSLPSNDAQIRKLAGLEENAAKWRKVREVALRGFYLCSDGRLYHAVIAEQALTAWAKRQERVEKNENETERVKRFRRERKAMFDQLRTVGVNLRFDTPMSDLRRHFEHHFPGQPVTVSSALPVTGLDTRNATAMTGHDMTQQNTHARVDTLPLPEVVAARVLGDAEPEPIGNDPGNQTDPPAPPPKPTPAGRICRALREAGVPNVNPAHPTLLVLLEAGATEEEFIGAAAQARGKGNPFAYLLQVLVSQRQRAKATAGTLATGAIRHETTAQASKREAFDVMTGSRYAAPAAPPIGEPTTQLEAPDGTRNRLA